MTPRVLITGGTGLLGKALLETVPEGVRAFATHHRLEPPERWRGQFRPLDVRQAQAVDALFSEVKPDGVIHTASIGGVDEAEKNPEAVRAVNAQGTQAILRACQKVGATLLFISSNAVFDGSDPPYREDSPLRAVNRYGQIKIEAERLVVLSGVPHLIVRPILMYGWPWKGGRENAVTRWLKSLEKGESVEVAEDIVSMPLWVGDCARAIWRGLLEHRGGVVHLAGRDRVNLVRFAQEVCRVFSHDERRIIPISSQRWLHLAPRPRDTSFEIARMRWEFEIEPVGIREGLTLMREARVSVEVGPAAVSGQGL